MFKLTKGRDGEPFFHRALLEGYIGTCLQSLRTGSDDYKSEVFHCNFWEDRHGERTVATTKSLRMKYESESNDRPVLKSIIPVVLSLMHFLANNKDASLLKAMLFDMRSQGAEEWLLSQLDYQDHQKSKKKRERKLVPRSNFICKCENPDVEDLLSFAPLRIIGELLSLTDGIYC